MAVIFENYSMEVITALKDAGTAWLTESSAEIISQTQKNSRVDTSGTKASFRSDVDAAAGEATLGSDAINAIYEEFGTGQYALKGDGRATSWVYKDPKTGKFYRTKGKTPTRAFEKAYKSVKPKAQARAQAIFGGL